MVWASGVFLKFIVDVLIFKWLIRAYDFSIFINDLPRLSVWIIILTASWILVVFKLIFIILDIRVYLVFHFLFLD